jgi:hypothetical protein
MRAAGYRGPDLFQPRALAIIARASAGLTRRINILCDKALLAAFTESTHAITDRHVRAAVADSEFAAVSRPVRPALLVAATLAAGIAVGAVVQWWFFSGHAEPAAPAQAQAALAPVKPAAVEKPVEEKSPPPEKPAADKPVEPPPSPAPPEQPPSRLSDVQASRLAGYSAGRQKLLGERLAAARELLTRAPDESYAIELFNTDNSDPARMERFLLRARELVRLEDLVVIPLAAGGGQYRLRVVYGEFPTREAALEAERRLPPRYQNAFRTSPRSFAELRSQI